jgi:DNA-directed RNA polymerase specialized sigma24 family protein
MTVMSERIFDLYENGHSSAEIAKMFDIEVFEVSSIVHRVRKRRERKAREKVGEVVG